MNHGVVGAGVAVIAAGGYWIYSAASRVADPVREGVRAGRGGVNGSAETMNQGVGYLIGVSDYRLAKFALLVALLVVLAVIIRDY